MPSCNKVRRIRIIALTDVHLLEQSSNHTKVKVIEMIFAASQCPYDAILEFVERQITPHLSMMEKIVVGGAINLVSRKFPALIDNYMGGKFFTALEVYDKEQGRLDIDAL